MTGALPSDLRSVKGGVEAAILNLFSGFTSLNELDLVHLTFSPIHKEAEQVSLSDNVKVYFIPFRSRFKLIDYFLNRGVLNDILKAENPDLIHIQESEPHLLRFIHLDKKKIVVTQHGIMREEFRHALGLRNKLKFAFKWAIEKFIFPRFKNVIFISDYNRKLYGVRPDHEALICNAVNPIFFNAPIATALELNSLLYVGVISPRKNIIAVIHALNFLKLEGFNYRLHVVGGYKSEDKDYENQIWELIRRYRLQDQIVFHGWLTQTEILEVYQSCGFFILPSRQETLPISIAEAMALGKIVVASDVGAVSEMFDHGVSGYLYSRKDISALVSLLRDLWNNDRDMNHSEKVRAAAFEKFAPVEIARKTTEFYRLVLK